MRLPHTLRWRVAAAYTILIIFSLGLVSLYLIGFVRQTYLDNLQERLHNEALLIGEASASFFVQPPPDLAALGASVEHLGNLANARVTIIDADGVVLADNWQDPSDMENHAFRPEVVSALETGLGRATRVSGIDNRELVYTAVPIAVEGRAVGVARVALATDMIQANVNRIIGTVAVSGLVVAGLAITLAFYLAHRTSRSVISVTEGARRLAQGDLEHRVQAISQDETQELARAFNTMAASVRTLVRDLSEEKNKLTAVLDTMADGVIVINQEGVIEIQNQAAVQLLRLNGAGAGSRRFMDAVRDHDLQHLVEACRASGERRQGEVELLQQRRFLSAIATPLEDGGGKSVLLTLHDLTRIRQVETTRREFVSNVSHELRSPLASVKAMVETLEDGAVSDTQVAQDFLQRIKRDVDRMASMVNDLLELSRLESGQAVLDLQATVLASLVAEALAFFQASAEARRVELVNDIPADLPAVVADSEKVRQVLVNLLDNALRFTPAGGRIRVSAERQGPFVQVTVADTGAGIPAEHLPHVFERFYKVDRSRGDGGTGLGLAIVKHVVQSHGGSVSARSTAGEGSAFTFSLPVAK